MSQKKIKKLRKALGKDALDKTAVVQNNKPTIVHVLNEKTGKYELRQKTSTSRVKTNVKARAYKDIKKTL